MWLIHNWATSSYHHQLRHDVIHQQLHIEVHFSVTRLQRHLPYVHPLVLPHIIISDELSGTGINDISFGRVQLSLSLTQPRVFVAMTS